MSRDLAGSVYHDAKLYERYHRSFTEAGYAVLVFDYRGFGDSEGERGLILPMWQAEVRNGITYMQTRSEVDPNRIGLFGLGGTGGALPIYVAAVDHRVKCVVSDYGFFMAKTGCAACDANTNGLRCWNGSTPIAKNACSRVKAKW